MKLSLMKLKVTPLSILICWINYHLYNLLYFCRRDFTIKFYVTESMYKITLCNTNWDLRNRSSNRRLDKKKKMKIDNILCVSFIKLRRLFSCQLDLQQIISNNRAIRTPSLSL